jgi:hypothetical protein
MANKDLKRFVFKLNENTEFRLDNCLDALGKKKTGKVVTIEGL